MRTPEAWHERAKYLWDDPRARFGLVYPLREVPLEEFIAQRAAAPEISQEEIEHAIYPHLASPIPPSAPIDDGEAPVLSDAPQ